MNLDEKFEKLVERYKTIHHSLSFDSLESQEFTKLSKEYADLSPIVECIEQRTALRNALWETERLLSEDQLDAELKAMAEDEERALKAQLVKIDFDLKVGLLPKDEADEKNSIMEIRAGTGGEEAGLFAAELLRMYQRYAENKGWKSEIISYNETGIGGIREAIINIRGKGVYARLKFESGVHRVQRVPATEANGRIHTSAATVAVLPEAEEVDIVISDNDLRIDVFRSSGPGGQSVNTTDSAVRITHLPTGLVVQQQDEKSQHKNKAKALKILRTRLYELERQKIDAERAANRKTQVGSGDRSERIRTFNFPQGRVSDHRINLTLYKIEQIMEGEGLDEIIDALISTDQAARLADTQ